MIQINTLPGFEQVLDIYFITKDGKVYSTQLEKFKRTRITSNGYEVASLKFKTLRRWKKAYIHRLVALAYIPGYREGLQVNHRDENKRNNHSSNLEWMTHRENNNYGTKNERMVQTKCNPVYVYDYKLNFIGEFLGTSSAARATIGRSTSKVLDSRVEEYFYLSKNDINLLYEIDSKSRYKSVVLENILTGEKQIFPTTRSLRDEFFQGKVNISNAIKYNKLIRKTYRVYQLNYKELKDMPTLWETIRTRG